VEVISDVGTYISQVRPDGGYYDQGEGYFMTSDNETVVWKGSGLGKIKEDGGFSYRGILYHKTESQKLARLNTTPVLLNMKWIPKTKPKRRCGSGNSNL